MSAIAEPPPTTTSEPAAGTRAAGCGEAALERVRRHALGRLSAPLAHELRNLLTGAQCYTELLQDLELPAEARGFVREVAGTIDQIGRLIRNWSELVHGRAATAHPNLELQRLVGLLQEIGCGKRVRFELELDDEVTPAAVDGGRLQAALLALIGELLDRRPRRIVLATVAGDGWLAVRLTAEEAGADPGPCDLDGLAAAIGGEVLSLAAPAAGFELRLAAALGVRD